MTLRLATCAYPIEAPGDFSEYAAKQTKLVAEAAEGGAQLLVFPEYASVELSSILPAAVRGDLQRELHELQPLAAPMSELFAELADPEGNRAIAPGGRCLCAMVEESGKIGTVSISRWFRSQ